MKKSRVSRRKFIGTATTALIGTSAFGINILEGCNKDKKKDIVSIVKVKNGNVTKAVEEAIELLGGISQVTSGQDRILLKPNLVAPDRNYITNPEVVVAVAKLMQDAGKQVMIGEGSAAAESFNSFGDEQFITKKKDILDGMQRAMLGEPIKSGTWATTNNNAKEKGDFVLIYFFDSKVALERYFPPTGMSDEIMKVIKEHQSTWDALFGKYFVQDKYQMEEYLMFATAK